MFINKHFNYYKFANLKSKQCLRGICFFQATKKCCNVKLLTYYLGKDKHRQMFNLGLAQLYRKSVIINNINEHLWKNLISNFNNKIIRGTNFGKTDKNFVEIQIFTICFK